MSNGMGYMMGAKFRYVMGLGGLTIVILFKCYFNDPGIIVVTQLPVMLGICNPGSWAYTEGAGALNRAQGTVPQVLADLGSSLLPPCPHQKNQERKKL